MDEPMNNEIHIGSAADQRYYPGLVGTLASLLINSDRSRIYHFHILYEGICESYRLKLDRLLRQINSKSIISWYEPDLTIFSSFPAFFFDSKLTYARILFPSIVNESKLIYVDSDILFMKDAAELWDYDLNGQLAGMAQDLSVVMIKDDCPEWRKYGYEPESPAFNCGLIIMDLDQFREKSISELTLNHLTSNPQECLLHDQSALNYSLYDRIIFLDSSWNSMVNHMRFDVDLSLVAKFKLNIHFVTNVKPWLRYTDELLYHLFRDLLDLCNISYKNTSFIYQRLKVLFWNKNLFLMPFYYKLRIFINKIAGNNKKAEFFCKQLASYVEKLKKCISDNEQYADQYDQIRSNWKKKIKEALSQ
jgi:lipopolysaccharide biosynthesis glycosyltransferase